MEGSLVASSDKSQVPDSQNCEKDKSTILKTRNLCRPTCAWPSITMTERTKSVFMQLANGSFRDCSARGRFDRSGISSQREAESAVNLNRPVVVTGHGQLQSSRTLGTSPGNYCIDQLAADSKPPVARRDPHGHQMCPA